MDEKNTVSPNETKELENSINSINDTLKKLKMIKSLNENNIYTPVCTSALIFTITIIDIIFLFIKPFDLLMTPEIVKLINFGFMLFSPLCIKKDIKEYKNYKLEKNKNLTIEKNIKYLEKKLKKEKEQLFNLKNAKTINKNNRKNVIKLQEYKDTLIYSNEGNKIQDTKENNNQFVKKK